MWDMFLLLYFFILLMYSRDGHKYSLKCTWCKEFYSKLAGLYTKFIHMHIAVTYIIWVCAQCNEHLSAHHDVFLDLILN